VSVPKLSVYVLLKTDLARRDPAHHIAGVMMETSPDTTPTTSPNINSLSNNAKLRLSNEKRRGLDLPGVGVERGQPSGFWHDVKTMRWMRDPSEYMPFSEKRPFK
jgi:hypothetical protein